MLKIVFSYPGDLPNEIVLVNELLASDIDYFHVRKPNFEENEMIDYLQQLSKVSYHKIIIHSYYRLVHKFELGGIHLNKKGLSELRTEEESDKCFIEPLLLKNGEILINNKKPGVVSYAAHSFNDIKRITFKTDYILLSPVFNSISKPHYQSNFADHNMLRTELKETDRMVIALGGIKNSQEQELKKLGFSGYALLGDYWKEHLATTKY